MRNRYRSYMLAVALVAAVSLFCAPSDASGYSPPTDAALASLDGTQNYVAVEPVSERSQEFGVTAVYSFDVKASDTFVPVIARKRPGWLPEGFALALDDYQVDRSGYRDGERVLPIPKET